MRHRNDRQSPLSSDETFRSLASAGGDQFWRSVWKGIENSATRQPATQRERDLTPQPPLDYVVEAEQGLYR